MAPPYPSQPHTHLLRATRFVVPFLTHKQTTWNRDHITKQVIAVPREIRKGVTTVRTIRSGHKNMNVQGMNTLGNQNYTSSYGNLNGRSGKYNWRNFLENTKGMGDGSEKIRTLEDLLQRPTAKDQAFQKQEQNNGKGSPRISSSQFPTTEMWFSNGKGSPITR